MPDCGVGWRFACGGLVYYSVEKIQIVTIRIQLSTILFTAAARKLGRYSCAKSTALGNVLYMATPNERAQPIRYDYWSDLKETDTHYDEPWRFPCRFRDRYCARSLRSL